MNITDQERHAPTKEQLDDVLSLLAEANEAGQLASITFMLKNGEKAMVDYRGSMEHTELSCREVSQRIAKQVERDHPKLAAAIRMGLTPIAGMAN